jgi:hypothetical protein
MKKIIFFLLITILTIPLFACDNKNNFSSNLQLVEAITYSPLENIAIDIPTEYKEEMGNYGILTYKKNNASIIVTSEPTKKTDDDVAAYGHYALKQYSDTFDKLSDIEEIYFEVNGLQCKVNQFKYIIYGEAGEMDDIERYCYVGYIVKDGTAYIISCVSTVPTFEYNKIGFEQAVKSFRFLD